MWVWPQRKPKVKLQNESTTAAKGVNNLSKVIGSTDEAQELGGYRVSKPTVAEPAESLDHAMENQGPVEHDLPSTFWEVE